MRLYQGDWREKERYNRSVKVKIGGEREGGGIFRSIELESDRKRERDTQTEKKKRKKKETETVPVERNSILNNVWQHPACHGVRGDAMSLGAGCDPGIITHSA